MQIGVRIEGLDRVMRNLSPATYQPAVRAGIAAGAKVYKGEIAQYPIGNPHRPQPFVSDAQRRGFFYYLKAGKIQVPYQRGQPPHSERLLQSWAVKVRNWYSAVIGTDASYARLVQDETMQTRHHAGTRWRTVQGVARSYMGKITRAVNVAFWQALRRRMK